MGQLKNTILLKELGKRIKGLREAKGVTQEIFYYDTGINPVRIESGEYNYTISTLDAIAKYLQVSLAELLKDL
jgi:transcriptional regulator with XRE-family HTH domain